MKLSDLVSRGRLSVVAEDNCSKLSMSESHPDGSLKNDQSDTRDPSDMTTELADDHGAKLDTSDVENGPVAEETLNVDQQAIESSAPKKAMPEDQTMAEESVKEQHSSPNIQESAAPRQEEEFVVVQLTDGQQGEPQGTATDDILYVVSMCVNSHSNWRLGDSKPWAGGACQSPCNAGSSGKRKKRHDIKYCQCDSRAARAANNVKHVFRSTSA